MNKVNYQDFSTVFAVVAGGVACSISHLAKEVTDVFAVVAGGVACSISHLAKEVTEIERNAFTRSCQIPSQNNTGISRHFSKVEGDTDFRSHAGVFFTTNEHGFDITIDSLKEQPSIGDTIIGVAGFFNFELILARADKGVKHFISIDPDPAYKVFWQLVGTAFKESKTGEEFIAKLMPVLRGNYEKLVPKDRRKLMPKNEFSDGWMKHVEEWYFPELFKESGNFEKLKTLFDEGNFYHFPIDLSRQGKAEVLRGVMKASRLTLDTIYVSNVREFVENRLFWKSNIDCFEKECETTPLCVYGQRGDGYTDPLYLDDYHVIQHLRSGDEEIC